MFCGLLLPFKTSYTKFYLILSCFKVKNHSFDNISAFLCEKTTNARKCILYEYWKILSQHFPPKKFKFVQRCQNKEEKNTPSNNLQFFFTAKCLNNFLQHSYKIHFLGRSNCVLTLCLWVGLKPQVKGAAWWGSDHTIHLGLLRFALAWAPPGGRRRGADRKQMDLVSKWEVDLF